MHACMQIIGHCSRRIFNSDVGMNSSSTSPSEELIPCSTRMMPPPAVLERRLRPQQDQALKCPRCESTHTKFCYYNNYSLSQPRYFCKTCRRYWTKGGSLRNIPVGGGCRKNNKRAGNGGKKPMHVTAAEGEVHSPFLLDHGQYHLLNTTTTPTAPFFGEQRGPDLHHSTFSGLLPPITHLGMLSAGATQRDLASFMECKYDVSMFENPDQHVGDVDRYGAIIGNPMTAQLFSCGNNDDGYGDMSSTAYHGMSPLGFSMNGTSHQSLMSTALSFDGNEPVDGETKPNGKLLSLEWQDSGRDVGFNSKWTSWDNFHI